ncbi:MAG: lipoprotein [Burkholderiales bacterium]|nr:lipoprotein [Burkholderiales bacterium]
MKKTILTISSLTILVACGYKGALYLPKNGPASSNPANNQYAPKNDNSMPEKSLLPAIITESPTVQSESSNSTAAKTESHNVQLESTTSK